MSSKPSPPKGLGVVVQCGSSITVLIGLNSAGVKNTFRQAQTLEKMCILPLVGEWLLVVLS